jgi:hypothetical protein
MLAAVIIADVIAAGLHLGCFCLIKAATPAMWGAGAAMPVPDTSAKFCPARMVAWMH